MIKKMIVSFMFFATVTAWGYASYRICAPEQAPIINVNALEQVVVVPSSTAFALEGRMSVSAQPSVYYYCTDTDPDCQYVNDQILPMLASNLNVTIINEIQYIDINSLDVETSTKLKSEYGFATYPAFVIYETDNGESLPVAALEFNKESPLTVVQLETWLNDNNVISVK